MIFIIKKKKNKNDLVKKMMMNLDVFYQFLFGYYIMKPFRVLLYKCYYSKVIDDTINKCINCV